MARKIYDFPIFDIKALYEEFQKLKVKPFKQFIKEYQETYPEEIILPLKKKQTIIEEQIEERVEEKIQINIIEDNLPFTIDTTENYNQFIESIKSFEEQNLDLNNKDIERNLKVIAFVEVYYPDGGQIEFKNEPTTYNISVPVTGNRRKWLIKTIQSLYNNIITRVIKRYAKQGLKNSPGKNIGSLDWRLIIEEITYYIN